MTGFNGLTLVGFLALTLTLYWCIVRLDDALAARRAARAAAMRRHPAGRSPIPSPRVNPSPRHARRGPAPRPGVPAVAGAGEHHQPRHLRRGA